MADEPTNPNPSPATTEPAESGSESPRSPSQSEAAAASSPASSPGSSPFVSEPGPAFDPGARQEEPAEPAGATLHALPAPAIEWEEQQVRDILNAQGEAAHALFGVGQRDWAYTEADLATIARPLTRILNRYDVTRAAAGTGDELAVVIGFGGYIGRSYQERKAVLDALAAEVERQGPEPVSGRAAEPDTGPPPPQAPHFAGADEPYAEARPAPEPVPESPPGEAEAYEWNTGN